MINVRMQSPPVESLAPRITVVGVGGAGGNAVDNMIVNSLEGVSFLVCNTDAQALARSLSDIRIQLGTHVTAGLGAGSKPEVGRAAAEESIEDIMQHLDGANMVFITAGMGGGTGTGAAPVIARAAREAGILTVGVVTKPFHFEGTHRMRMAEEGIKELQQYVDTLLIIPNQNLFRVANEKTTFAEAFKMADGVLQSGVRGVTDLMVMPGLINLDFADIRTAMTEMGKAMMGTGEATGERRAIEAAEAAINNPLLDDVSMKGARGVIINVTGGYDMTLFEADEACNRIRDEVDPNANIIFGATFADNMEGKIRVSVVATGIEGERFAREKSDSAAYAVKAVAERTIGERAHSTTTAPVTAHAYARPAMPQAPVYQPQPVVERAPAPVYIPPTPAREPIVEEVAEVQAPIQQVAAAGGYSASVAATQPTLGLSRGMDMTPARPEAAYTPSWTAAPAMANAPARVGTTAPSADAMRGARYKDAFIPPQPVEPQGGMPVSEFGPQMHRVAEPQPEMIEQTQTQQRKKRSPSLFERITGGLREQEETLGQAAEAGQEAGFSLRAPQRPTQGRLNIDAPAKPGASIDDELDIPAFLRRQAN